MVKIRSTPKKRAILQRLKASMPKYTEQVHENMSSYNKHPIPTCLNIVHAPELTEPTSRNL